ncbi:MAG: UDP-N-acetylmuramoyl-tripeptide--D-alanyl-D-alanine ligase [Actinobacteria bacterium]|uniref:UDP-MurNAc-pentapeptide synthetase n=1 Tax=freshwater metagenome TaxID=449393 RepID=A0A6J7D419_9ZZZZ|nr:UDP-N-acetylmuramoyl-tripeptide--D-alanyl-D-alanine ligase [Actinomycetota bacterium]
MSRASFTAQEIADITGAQLVNAGQGHPNGFSSDSREIELGNLFIGIPGERVDGGTKTAEAISAGAWGGLVSPAGADGLVLPQTGGLLVHPDPVEALGLLAAAWRSQLSCPVIAITGSTGKTSTKDILGAILGSAGTTFSSAGNRNTEVGLPLELLRIDDEVSFVVLELAMRAEGEIAHLTQIAAPTVGVVLNAGPVHLETLGSIEAVAKAKAELIAGLPLGGVSVTPALDGLLAPYLRPELRSVTFGPGGDCRLVGSEGRTLTVDLAGDEYMVEVDFDQPHNRLNLLAAVAAAGAVGVQPPKRLKVPFSGLRGQRKAIEGGIVVIDDCYNANPMSMRAALADLSEESLRRGGRAVAVLGDMLELGPDEVSLHTQLGADILAAGVDVLVTVGPLSAVSGKAFGATAVVVESAQEASERLADLVQSGDTVLVKGSRGIGLEVVAQSLGAVDG